MTWSETARRYPDRAHQLIWAWLAGRGARGRLVNAYGRYVQGRQRSRQTRRPDSEHTFFLRNSAQFEMLRDLARDWPAAAPLRIASVGCSTGAELYSALWTVHSTRADLDLAGTGVDVSEAALATAHVAHYERAGRELQRLDPGKVKELVADGLFIEEGETLTVPGWFRECARWELASVFDHALPERIGPQDIVFVNNVLCHFHNVEAEAALKNVVELVGPGGYLFLSGIDPDVKIRVVAQLGLIPVLDRIEELYTGDARALTRWPMTYWGPEPFDRTRRDWVVRYGTVFRRRPEIL